MISVLKPDKSYYESEIYAVKNESRTEWLEYVLTVHITVDNSLI